ncbi:hypothetical protein MVEN_00172300 [Mycena venus]|uniref:Uncharacterized protein n=1 Tax=Mycena venus TaxID=2733690 RepID=A0A8H6Z165_9AGAR|nr:hypothetical protein MVEN_00172300 [Mycena venus]
MHPERVKNGHPTCWHVSADGIPEPCFFFSHAYIALNAAKFLDHKWEFFSKLPADVWDVTSSTNDTNEAQHHWTDSLPCIKLTSVEALESRRKVDHDVADEIRMSLKTGILPNHNSELSHRMVRSTQHHPSAINKANESREAADISAEFRLQIEAEAEKPRASNLATKSLKAQRKAAKDASGKRAKSGEVLSANLSGCVKTPRTRAAAQTPVNAMQSDDTSAPVSAIPAAPS